MMKHQIAIIIPVFNKLEYTQKCLKNLDSVFSSNKELEEQYQIIVVDDASTDNTSGWIQSNYPKVHLLKGDGNLWWSGGINLGAMYAIKELGCSHLLLWNNDIHIDPEYFMKVAEYLNVYDDSIILGSKIYADNERSIVWSMGGTFNPYTGTNKMNGFMVPDDDNYKKPVEADWLTGMGTIVPSSVVRKIGYWNKEYFPQYFGDAEFTYRAKINGYKNMVIPELIIWNDITNTGLKHGGNIKTIFKMLTDNRSLYNFRANFKFYRLYSKSPSAYAGFIKNYIVFFGGFIKWKILGWFGIQKNRSF